MTAAILEVHKKIRHALQIPLYDAALAGGVVLPGGMEPAIQWGPMPFERVGLAAYFAVQISTSGVVVHETGPNPMVEGLGHVTINCRSKLELGQDGNDALAGIIATAYPYASTPSFDGISVFIDTATHGGYGSDGPYLTGLVTVNWNIYRRP